ncbi:T9SS type A sorting domain-containing protein [Cryomorphaceae bacterium 1068]|nr:T9SS type A sorting domain-containing protein [Cryomorphaceae bacterium 1068]
MKAHFYLLIIGLSTLVGLSPANAQSFEYCDSNFDYTPVELFDADLASLCVEFPNAVTSGCSFEMFDAESIPQTWRDEVSQNSQKWNQIPANTDIEIDLSFNFVHEPWFGPAPNPYSNPFDNVIQVNWRGEAFLVNLSEQEPGDPGTGGLGSSRIFGSFTFNSGPAIIDGDLSAGLEIIFFNNETGDPAYAAATWMFVEGEGILNDPEWTTTAPAVPQIILRDPPGDGSFTELLQGDETCHGHSISLSKDESNSVWGSAKLGVSGEVGFLVTTEVETFVEVSAGLEMGFTETTVDESKLCVRVENTYSTSIDDPILQENSGDLYIGSAITYAYGVFKTISMNGNCEVIEDNSLAFLPVSSNGFFIYPEGYITGSIIPDLEENLASLDPDSDEYRLVADQLEVWQENIQMNADIKDAAFAEQVPATAQFLAGSSTTNSITTTTAEMQEIEYNMYIEESAAIEAGVYVSGSGGSLGSQVRSKTTKGSTSTSSNVHSTEISYTFNDDDSGTGNQDGDVFSVNIYQDLTFGTPIFDLVESESSTSCPYEGGYQIDNPDISFSESGTINLTIEDIPDGETSTFEVDICNESDFDREYFVYVPLESNLNGLQVQLAGTPINVTDGVTTGVIAGNTCLEGVDVTISQTVGSPELNYEDVKIELFTPCQPGFEPSTAVVTFDAFFSNTLSTDELASKENGIKLYPNPNNGQFTIELDDLSEMSTLQVHDLTGRLVYQTILTPGSDIFDLQLESGAKGMYILSLSGNDRQRVQRFTTY